jgi:hypothetical protein
LPIDARIHLDRLRCLEQHEDGGSEPYAWTILLWVDDTAFTSGLPGSLAPSNSPGFRAVIKEGMDSGEQASMPSVQRSFVHRFEDGLVIRQIAIVAALFEEDETPSDAVRAGYRAFVREVPQAVADFYRAHNRGPDPDDQQELDEIADAVRPKVRSAMEDALSAFEKLQIALGTLNLDDVIGFDVFSTDIDEEPPRSFTLNFTKTVEIPLPDFPGRPNVPSVEVTTQFEIDGRFELREPPPPDPCQAEVERVREAREKVEGIQADIKQLQSDLQEAPPAEKPSIVDEIERLKREELPAAVARLESAQRALALCRASQDTRLGRFEVVDPLAGFAVASAGE